MKLLVVVVILVCLGCVTCSTVSCSYYCTRSVRYTTGCGLFYWWRCTRYRRDGSTCYKMGVNGAWSSWSTSGTGSCSVTCGLGTRVRTDQRHCNHPAPTDCGAACPGNSTRSEYESCDAGCCPVSGGWSDWELQDSSPCSVTCGSGTRTVTYQRTCSNPVTSCGGVTCSGSSTTVEKQSCNTDTCPVDGRWSDWNQWHSTGECSALCGGGQELQVRERQCDNPAPAYGGKMCDGDEQENRTITCNQDNCADRCPQDRVTFIPHTTNNRLYYQCDNGVAVLRQCGVGTVWDQLITTCVHDGSQQPQEKTVRPQPGVRAPPQ